jgi:hypothetical protein
MAFGRTRSSRRSATNAAASWSLTNATQSGPDTTPGLESDPGAADVTRVSLIETQGGCELVSRWFGAQHQAGVARESLPGRVATVDYGAVEDVDHATHEALRAATTRRLHERT